MQHQQQHAHALGQGQGQGQGYPINTPRGAINFHTTYTPTSAPGLARGGGGGGGAGNGLAWPGSNGLLTRGPGHGVSGGGGNSFGGLVPRAAGSMGTM